MSLLLILTGSSGTSRSITGSGGIAFAGTYGIPQLLPPDPVRRSLKYRLTHHALRLPDTWRTSFCAKKPGCGCARRQAKLNQIVPEIRSAKAWIHACKALATRLNSHFRYPLKTP